jgi:protein gp37
MAKETKIEWADATWNPFIGCSKVSPACDNCYAETWAKRCGRDFNKVVRAAAGTFYAPEKWKNPKRIFVCSLSDFFHPDILDEDRHAAMNVMCCAPHHTYMLLTKRPENIKSMLAGTSWAEALAPNVWIGVTVENQEQADKRIPLLLQVPAKVRFVSCEPLLGPITLTELHYKNMVAVNALNGLAGFPRPWSPTNQKLNWVIAGGESGPHARPMHPAWARLLRDQCAAAGVPFLFKQWGKWCQPEQLPIETYMEINDAVGIGISSAPKGVGVKRAGRLLDGVEHNGRPE